MNTTVGLYIHVPFCLRKCHYCDFYSLPLAEVSGQTEAYVQAVCREMALCAAQHADRAPFIAPTLYLGGGTPSLLRPEHLERLLQAARTHFGLREDAEITMEGNPGTLTAAKARAYRSLGVNRFSLGVQSFEDAILQRLGRVHSVAQSVAAVQILRDAGFANLSLDLMFALPGQTPESWRDTLRQAIALQPEHLSAYSLIIEEGTPFFAWERAGQLPRPDEDAEVEMFETTLAVLGAAGYEHYEISNFARPGRRSLHNQIYWRNEAYLGFGPAAAGYLDGVRSVNVRSLPDYLAMLAAAELPVGQSERVSRAVAMGETMMVGLRLRDGVELARFAQRFGVSLEEIYAEPLRRLTARGLLRVTAERVALTHQGLLLANNVMAEFLP